MDSFKSNLTRRTLLAASGGAVGAAALAAAGAKVAETSANQSAPASHDFGGALPVAFVMGPQATMIDFAGPWEVFQDTGGKGFFLYTVSDSTGELHTTGNMLNGKMTGMRFRPDYSFADAPRPKVIVMGAQGEHTQAKIAWVRQAAAQADVVLSVCTGAFLLAKTGLLDGLSATTHHDFFESFEKQFPKVKVERTAQFVDNGKFVTAGGLTSGIDGALHVVDRLYGRAAAEATAIYMEHTSKEWQSA